MDGHRATFVAHRIPLTGRLAVTTAVTWASPRSATHRRPLNSLVRVRTMMLEAALACAARAWPVLPLWWPVDGVCACPKEAECSSPGKHPLTPTDSRTRAPARRLSANGGSDGPARTSGSEPESSSTCSTSTPRKPTERSASPPTSAASTPTNAGVTDRWPSQPKGPTCTFVEPAPATPRETRQPVAVGRRDRLHRGTAG
jgi:hypothetical protein